MSHRPQVEKGDVKSVRGSKDSIYDQICVTLLLSELCYAVSLLRDLARQKQLNGDYNEAALQLPINAAELKRIIAANPQLTETFESHNEDPKLQFAAVDNLKERSRLVMEIEEEWDDFKDAYDVISSVIGKPWSNLSGGEDLRCSTKCQGSRLVHFSDQDDRGYREQTQMVYGIGVNDIEKRVTVAFRGSRCPADWKANLKFAGTPVKNPLLTSKEFASDKSLPKKVYVHRGFYAYLHKRSGTSDGIFEVLLPILKQYPGYTLWITGHSLGGGLASLFAVEAACHNEIPKPVCCITHAQPIVGDKKLSISVQKLENARMLRLLRTRCDGDGVPGVPAFSPSPLAMFSYRHFGMELRLYGEKKPINVTMAESQFGSRAYGRNLKDMSRLFVFKQGKEKQNAQRRLHSIREHFELLEKYEEEINKIGSDLEDVCSRRVNWQTDGVSLKCKSVESKNSS